MSQLVRQSVMSGLPRLRHEPTAKRIRAKLGEFTVVDSTRAVLLWEPRRIVPSWAVPVDDVAAALVPVGAAARASDDVGFSLPSVSDRPVLDPSVPFAAHTADGEAVDVVVGGQRVEQAGLRLADPDLADYVVLDFNGFDWLEEDEPNIGHPRDPFHRIDIVASSRHVRLERDGTVLAESSRPRLLFETLLPARWYLPREDVRVPLVASAKRTTCAYKGHASYFSPVVGEREITDLAWTYEHPLREANEVSGLIAFFNERVDVVVDGELSERPITPWS
jgi:uncharacterized protein (DUF427 family)